MPINGFPGQVISATAPSVTTAGATGIWGLDEQLQYAGQNLWPGYQISRSVRLRLAASAYFNRTPASTTNRRTMTFSFWMKRGLLTYSSNYIMLFNAYPVSSSVDVIAFSPSSDSLRVWFNGSASADLVTTQVFRDPSAWYHVVVAIDTTQATSSDRIKVYVNGSQITAFSTATYPSQNYDTFWNSSSYASAIGANLNGPQSYFDGYLTEINFIDGQQLTPSSFGVINAVTGVWSPIKYTGTYGYNGYYLNFSDNSAATAAAIGKDYSGNGNNWTPNNISVTAGATYDSMVDVPVQYGSDTGVGGELRGNYCVGNPINGDGSTWSSGNLNFSVPNGTGNTQATMGVSSGKWYFEFIPSVASPNATGIQQIGLTTRSINGVFYTGTDGSKTVNGTNSAYGATYTSGDVIGVAFDMDGSTVTFYKNNTSQGAISLSGAGITVATFAAGAGGGMTYTGSVNFGQRPFAYTAPSGYKALCTANFTAPAIPNGAQYMNATLYNGNSSTQTVNNSAGFYPDFNWPKIRSSTGSHVLVNSVVGGSKQLFSNLTNAEQTDTNITSAISSSGIALGNNSTGTGNSNITGYTYVLWQWLAGAGSSSSNTSGSITSTVSVNTTAGFSIVGYTGTGANATVGHGLGVAPSMIITKVRSTSGADWAVYHTSLGNTQYLLLDTTAAAASSINFWNNTSPTSSVFSVGISGSTNNSGNTMIAYCFAPIAGYSAFGSWQNNNSTSGTFTYLGFRPRFILLKNSDNTERWFIFDSARQTYNIPPPATSWLVPNDSTAEGANGATTATIDLLSNGFKIYTTNPASGEVSFGTRTYIYAAFAENPFKFSLAR